MKTLLLTALTTALGCVACQHTDAPRRERRIDPALSALTARHPNYETNSAVRQKMATDFDGLIDSLVENGMLADIPLKLANVSNGSDTAQMVAWFYTPSYTGIPNKILSDRLRFDLIAFVSDSAGSTLKEGRLYYVYGKYKRLKKEQAHLFDGLIHYSPELKVEPSNPYGDAEFYTGVLKVEIDSTKEATP